MYYTSLPHFLRNSYPTTLFICRFAPIKIIIYWESNLSNYIFRLFPPKLTDHMRTNSRKFLINRGFGEEQQRNNSAVRQSIFMPNKTKTSTFFIKKER